MDARVRRALETERAIDITTIGRTTGRPQRVEIWFHNLDGRLYITGLPGPRGWYANLRARPDFTFHLKGAARADLAARAVPVLDLESRRTTLARILERLGRPADLEAWVRESPLVEVGILTDPPTPGPRRTPERRPRPEG